MDNTPPKPYRQSVDELYKKFPARQDWPTATNDVLTAPLESEALRLVTKANNIDQISRFEKLKKLWCFDISESQLRSIAKCSSLEALYIENFKGVDFSPLYELGKLVTLSVDTCSKTETLEGLRKLRNLNFLLLTHFKNVRDLEPLSDLKSLKLLGVSGSIWTPMKVKSFAPLISLKELEMLYAVNIKLDDSSLQPLAELKQLRNLNLGNLYPVEEFAKLSQQLKTTMCSWFSPLNVMKFRNCKKCGRQTIVMLSGLRQPCLCTTCDKKKVDSYLAKWESLVG